MVGYRYPLSVEHMTGIRCEAGISETFRELFIILTWLAEPIWVRWHFPGEEGAHDGDQALVPPPVCRSHFFRSLPYLKR
jgi:hypothetical protein